MKEGMVVVVVGEVVMVGKVRDRWWWAGWEVVKKAVVVGWDGRGRVVGAVVREGAK